MRTFSLFLLLAVSISQSMAQSITFAHENWQAVLNKAKAENKLVFLDAYTTWCGPCKMMDKQVFPDPSVASFHNEHFVNAKFDMEKGEGLEIARKYRVRVYPTFLYLDGDGNLVHRAVGYRQVPDLLELDKTALNPMARMAAFDARYQSGEREPEFLYDYAMMKQAAYEAEAGSIAEAYLKTQKNWKERKNLQFIFTFLESSSSPFFEFFAQNQKDFEEAYGKGVVSQKIQQLVMELSYSKPDFSLDQIDAFCKKYFPQKAEQLTTSIHMNVALQKQDIGQYVTYADSYFSKFETNAIELNEAGWNIFQFSSDPAHLKKAVAWTQKSIKMDPGYYNYDTLASLYYKMGKKKPALKNVKTAIEFAKKDGEDYTSTQELLKKIEAL